MMVMKFMQNFVGIETEILEGTEKNDSYFNEI